MTQLPAIFGQLKDLDKFFVGFDEHFDHLNQLAQDISRNTSGYPPYNITKLDVAATSI